MDFARRSRTGWGHRPFDHPISWRGNLLSRLASILTLALLLSAGVPLLNAQSAADSLIVNKFEFSGNSATIAATKTCVSSNAPSANGTNLASCPGGIASSGTGLGSPVLYVITISNSSTITNPTAIVYDTVPAGFVWVSPLQYLQCPSTTCSSPATILPLSGSFAPNAVTSIGTFNIPYNGVIVIYILGYFTTSGTKTNFVSALSSDSPGLCVGRINCRTAVLDIPNNILLTDLEISKCVFAGNKCVTNPPTTAGTPVTYRITIANNGPGDDIFLAGLIQIRDSILNATTFPGFPVTYTISGVTCSISCTPGTANFSGTLTSFNQQDLTIATLSAGTSIPVGSSVSITFQVTFQYTACSNGTMLNQAALLYSNNSATLSDINPSNNISAQNAATVTLSLNSTACPPSLGFGKRQVSPSNPVGWVSSGGLPNQVTYEITVMNMGAVIATGVAVTDYLSKTSGTPVFSAKIQPGTELCNPSSACGAFTNNPTPIINQNNQGPVNALFSVTVNLNPMQTVTITYTVEYDPQCETSSGPNRITNIALAVFSSSTYRSSVTTNLPELAACKLSTCKLNFDDTTNTQASAADCTKPGPMPLASLGFPDTKRFTIFYQNLESVDLNIGTVQDVLSVSSDTYGSFPINYSYTCNFLAPNALGSPYTGGATATVKWTNPLFAGVQTINLAAPVLFKAGSTMMCGLTVSTLGSSPPNLPTGCQGAGLPGLVNSAFMDLSSNVIFNNLTDEFPPIAFGQASMYLPLCQNVILSKIGTQSVGVGQKADWTISASNGETDTVNGFSVTDPLPNGFSFVTGSGSCSPSSCAVTTSTILGVTYVTATFDAIPAGGQGVLKFSATAPLSAGPFINKATGTFAPANCQGNPICNPAGTYFLGSLTGVLNGQVLAPKLTKTFTPPSVAVGAATTLTFTITNVNGNPPQSGLGFTDTLPPGLYYVTSSYSSTCAGNPPAFSAGLQPNILTFSNGVLTSASCTITVQVKASSCGVFTNNQSSIGNVKNLDVTGISAALRVACDAFVEICKASSSVSPVTGSFTFTSPSFATIASRSITVPVGACSGPIPVQQGPVAITETLPAGVSLSAVAASGYNLSTGSLETRPLVSANLAVGTATITAVAGDISDETIATFTNQGQAGPRAGQLKICKVAGSGVPVGKSFSFTATSTSPATSQTYTLPAGPALTGGYCIVAGTSFPVGTKVVVTENTGGGLSPYFVSSVASPGGTVGGRTINATTGAGFTELTFTNSSFIVNTDYTNGTAINWISLPTSVGTPLPITITGNPGLPFTATTASVTGPAGWLTVSANQGVTPATLILSAAPLPIGTYSGTITIAAADGSAGVTVPVSYTVALTTPVLGISETHQGNFTRGQPTATYTVLVTNQGAAPTIGAVSVTNIVPDVPASNGLMLISMSGLGWDCSANVCTRGDALNPGASYPPITLAMIVPPDAPSQWTNQVSAAGGGSPVTVASDVTNILGTGPTISVVANGASESPVIAPNTWVEIKGLNLAPAGDTRTWLDPDFQNGSMPTQLDGVSVTVNDKAAYVFYISPTQVNILTPPDSLQGSVQVQLANNGTTSAPITVSAQAMSPSFFVFNGGPYVIATHPDGSLLGPVSLFPGSTTPVKPGETAVVYANGFGPTNVPVVSGSVAQSGTLSPLPAFTIGGIPATVSFAGLIGPGEFQFNVVVPASVADGDQPIMATHNRSSTQAGTLITIRH